MLLILKAGPIDLTRSRENGGDAGEWGEPGDA
jgi:hypothetical protein